MRFGIIKERKNPPDRRVVFSPSDLKLLKEQHPEAEVLVESSDIRVFTDQQYQDAGIQVVEDLSSCDVLFGVKEVPIASLIPNKKYFFFSHTIKKQPHNRALLKAIIEKKITLFDHETIVDENFKRLIGFGRYAGIVGAYNGIRAFGIKFELFSLPKAETLPGKDALVEKLRRLVLPPIKIVVTGKGKAGNGVQETLEAMKVKQVSVDDFLNKKYSEPVYVQLDVMDYYKRVDGGVSDKKDFYANPGSYESNFARFANTADIFMAAHFYATGAPEILSRKMLQAAPCTIKVIADISCDVNGPIAATIRASTIAQPLFGYHPAEDREVDIFHPAAIVVMSVDNLPCELPKDASEGFGEMFMEHVVPAFFNNDKDGLLERAKITDKGKLTPRFAYLEDFVNGDKFQSIPC